MRYIFKILLLVWTVGTACAQKTPLSLEDAILGGRKFAPERLSRLQWIPDSDRYTYYDSEGENPRVLVRAVKDGSSQTLFSLPDLNAALEKAGAEALSRMPGYSFDNNSRIVFFHQRQLCFYDWTTQSAEIATTYPEGAANLFRKGKKLAYTLGPNLFVSTPEKGKIQVTNDDEPGIRNGDATHRYEFGVDRGIFWAPDGDKVAFYRTDESMVTEYPILNLRQKPTEAANIRYPFAGAASHHVTLGVFDVASGKTVFMETGGDPEHYLTNIAWTPDGEGILIAELNRDQNALTMNRYNATTGKREKTLFEESDPEYVQPLHAPTFVPDTEGEFLWQSFRDGHDHLYHYDAEGKLLGQLTKGKFNVTEVHGMDEKKRYLYLSGTSNSGLGRHLMKVDLKKGSLNTLTPAQTGTHTAQLSPDKKYYLDFYTSRDVPGITSLRATKDGAQVVELLKSKDPMAEVAKGEMKLFPIKAADDKTDLWCRMILPVDFDPNKKYPVLTYVYNGPGVQIIRDVYGGAGALWMHTAAAEGMIVFSVDGRGSANRSSEFEQAIFRDLGTVEMADQLKGVEYLKTLPYVDADRLAIHGWSYGGFMTTGLMTRTPGTYKVGVAGGPVIDWSLYEVMYTERYLDTPQSNPEGFKSSKLTNYVEDLEGKLMLIHGTSDDVVVWQHSLSYLEACIDAGVQVDYFVYPNHPHNVRGKDRIHLMRKVLDYIQDNL